MDINLHYYGDTKLFRAKLQKKEHIINLHGSTPAIYLHPCVPPFMIYDIKFSVKVAYFCFIIYFLFILHSIPDRIMKNTKHFFLFVFIVFLLPAFASSQDTLPVLTKKDYDQWQILSQTDISPDGKWVAYRITRVEGNDTLFIRSMDPANDTTYAFSFGSGILFTRDSKWAAFRIGYPEKEIEKKKEKHQPVKYKMMLLHLPDGKTQLFKDIQSYDFARSSGFLAMKAYKPGKSKARGSDLILRNLRTGTTQNFGNTTEWKFNKPGDRLAWITDAANKNGNNVSLLDLTENRITILASDTSTFQKLSWEKEGRALAFLKAVYDTIHAQPTHHLLAFRDIYHPENKTEIIPEKITGFPDSMRIKESYSPQWSKDLSILYFGIDKWTPKPKKDKKKKKEKKEKEPGVDIWHWKDDPVQPAQKKRYGIDKNFTYLCAWDLNSKTFHRITDEKVRHARLTGDGKHVLVWTMKPYQPQFKLTYADYYIIDPVTGVRKEVIKHQALPVTSSPAGKYLLYFRDKNWWAYDIASGKTLNLTAARPVPFWNVRDDHPAVQKPPFGTAGWTNDDKKVLLYDEYDVWALSPDGSKADKLTNGRDKRIRYRVNRLDWEKKYIDTKLPVYFSMFGDTTKDSGFAVLLPKKRTVKTLLYEPRMNNRLEKAKKTNKFIYVAQTYVESPNVFYTAADFHQPRQVTHTNPQQAKYAWGKATLVSFKNRDGKELQGILHYPAKYEPGKKYPMLVYIYEIRSNSLHNYIVPSPKSFYNITNYVQQGYFVFQPDIVYKIDHPGESAVNCVVPAVEKMIATGMIDKKKIGIMGHSWGAYQTSFIITQTNLFSAAVAGAPLTDMISMYNSIYWNTGTPDQQIFEVSQGRFSKPWWSLLNDYMNNSPMFQASRINTPLLVAFGDQDGAVDWHQGIEMYITMRRMEKPMILLVYSGENHAVRKKENMLDYTRRINEFFDHYLLGKPAKPWIENGVKYIDKMEKEKSK